MGEDNIYRALVMSPAQCWAFSHIVHHLTFTTPPFWQMRVWEVKCRAQGLHSGTPVCFTSKVRDFSTTEFSEWKASEVSGSAQIPRGERPRTAVSVPSEVRGWAAPTSSWFGPASFLGIKVHFFCSHSQVDKINCDGLTQTLPHYWKNISTILQTGENGLVALCGCGKITLLGGMKSVSERVNQKHKKLVRA